jgi:hypothetical protein
MANFDPEKFLNEPLELYSWQTTGMLDSVIDFLKWRETNLRWQRQREIQKAQKEGANLEFDTPDEYETAWYRIYLIKGAEYRFDVRIAQSVRYAGFVDGYEYENGLKESVKSLKGISIWDENILGTSIYIEAGAVERYAGAAIEWVSTLDERCTTAGILK